MDSEPLKAKALELGFDLVGVCRAVPAPHLDAYRAWLAKDCHGVMAYMERQAGLREHPDRLLPGVRSIVAVGLNYNRLNPERPGYPRIARYALGRDYHKVVRGKLRRLSRWMEAEEPAAANRICVDSAPIFERDFAHLAGLGWFGKNTCLIDSRRGSWFVLGLLLTTADLEPDQPAEGGCGTCTRCVDACPTGAIVFEEDRWQVDARKCVSYLTIEAPASNGEGRIGKGEGPDSSSPSPLTAHPSPSSPWVFGCDVCQEVCPFNQPRPSQPLRARLTEEQDFLAVRQWPTLDELAEIDFDRWDHLTRGSAVRRAGWAGLRANAKRALRVSNNRP